MKEFTKVVNCASVAYMNCYGINSREVFREEVVDLTRAKITRKIFGKSFSIRSFRIVSMQDFSSGRSSGRNGKITANEACIHLESLPAE